MKNVTVLLSGQYIADCEMTFAEIREAQKAGFTIVVEGGK